MKKNRYIFFASLFFLGIAFLSEAQETPQSFKPTFKINGRIQYDFEFLTMGETSTAKNEFRRVHFSVAGNAAEKIKYKIEVDFARAELGFRDLYLQYTAGRYGDFAVGSMAEPTSLDMMTSSKYTPFFERAMLTNMQDFRWGSGVHYSNFNWFGNRAGLQLAYTFNGVNTTGFYDNGLEHGGNFIARFSGAPYQNKDKNTLLHLGVNYDNRTNDQASGYQLKSRPENHTGERVIVSFEDGGNVKRRTSLGLEAAAGVGPFLVQGEYKRSSIMTDETTFKVTGYYAFLTWFVTGEHRPYKNGTFDRMNPSRSIDQGGFGAIELMGRYSVMDAPGAYTTFEGMETAGKTQDVTLGVNWYLNPYVRVLYNFVVTDFAFKAPAPNDKELAQLIRFQADF